MEPITEDAILKVGQVYPVNCAVLENKDNATLMYVPVIGHIHKDPAFGTNTKHFHIDGRFADKGQVDKMGKTNHVIWTDHYSATAGYYYKRTEVRELKCLRLKTGIKPPWINQYGNDTKYAIWERG